MLEALINYFPVKEQGFAGVGALDYSKEERKKLAILSQKSKCEKCGPLIEILPVLQKKVEKIEEKPIIEEEKNMENDMVEKERLIEELNGLKETVHEQRSKINLSIRKEVKKETEFKKLANSNENHSSLTFDTSNNI